MNVQAKFRPETNWVVEEGTTDQTDPTDQDGASVTVRRIRLIRGSFFLNMQGEKRFRMFD
jgi:hypothetical protein